MNPALWFAQADDVAPGVPPIGGGGGGSGGGVKTTFTQAQLVDMQGDLMVFVPELRPTFVNGVDPRTGIREVADNGSHPHGIHQGWVWSVWLPFYPSDMRESFYRACIAQGKTHVALHVSKANPDSGYHGLRPMTPADCDAWGPNNATVHRELLAHGLIPICAGVSATAPVAPGFPAEEALIAMGPWDDVVPAAECTIAVHNAFPNAIICFERPQNSSSPLPMAGPGDPVTPTDGHGGAWIGGMQQKCPRFQVVLYEVNVPEGVDAAVAELEMCKTWWRDLLQNRFELDTYWKFWQGGNEADYRRNNDEVARRCPWTKGYLSGETPHEPPATPTGDTVIIETGDMIPIDQITFVGGPNIGTFAKTATITRFDVRTMNLHVEHTKEQSWPESQPSFPITYSMGLVLKCDGRWYASAPVECWRGLQDSGGPIQNQTEKDDLGNVGQIQCQWFYDNRWAPLHTRRPAPGELIGFFVVSGDTRNNLPTVMERSQIITFHLPEPDGVLFATVASAKLEKRNMASLMARV